MKLPGNFGLRSPFPGQAKREETGDAALVVPVLLPEFADHSALLEERPRIEIEDDHRGGDEGVPGLDGVEGEDHGDAEIERVADDAVRFVDEEAVVASRFRGFPLFAPPPLGDPHELLYVPGGKEQQRDPADLGRMEQKTNDPLQMVEGPVRHGMENQHEEEERGGGIDGEEEAVVRGERALPQHAARPALVPFRYGQAVEYSECRPRKDDAQYVQRPLLRSP